MSLVVKKIFSIRVSRDTAIGTATTVAKLVEKVSEIVNFGPTKGAAKIVQQILETINEVYDNDAAWIQLIERVVDQLLIVRRQFDDDTSHVPWRVIEDIQEFENALLNIRSALKPAERKGFMKRAMNKQKIKADLTAYSNVIDRAYANLMLSSMLGLRLSRQAANIHEHPPVNDQLRDQLFSADSTGRAANSLNSEDSLWEELGSDYRELPSCEIHLVPPQDDMQSGTVTFSNLSHAIVNKEGRLVKRFNGNERQKWIEEIKRWSKLKHPNLLQLYGYSRRRSAPNLFVVFQNAQARCLAAYLLNAFIRLDVPSSAAIICKMYNAALSAIEHVRGQFHLNEANSALVLQEAKFALDSGDNLIVSVDSPVPGGSASFSLFGTVEDLLLPRWNRRGLNSYFTRLSASGHAFDVSATHIAQASVAVSSFLETRCWRVDESFVPKQTSRDIDQDPMAVRTFIDRHCHVRVGDYGVLVPGQEEPSFQAFGNAVDDSCGVLEYSSDSWLLDYTSDQHLPVIQKFPRVGSLDLNEHRRKGFSHAEVSWLYTEECTDMPRAMRFLVNSVPLLKHVKKVENIVLVTKAMDAKYYRFSFPAAALSEPFSEGNPEPVILEDQLPVIYTRERDEPEQDLLFSQCQPDMCPPTYNYWDPRIIYQGRVWHSKRIEYIQLRKEDIIKEFGRVLESARSHRAMYSTRPIIESNPCWRLFEREYELLVQGSEPWCDVEEFLGEYP